MDKDRADALAKQIIADYFNEQSAPAQGNEDYSCNECRFDSYLCPHLYQRLKDRIAKELLNLGLGCQSGD